MLVWLRDIVTGFLSLLSSRIVNTFLSSFIEIEATFIDGCDVSIMHLVIILTLLVH